jgi:hypothetical protein
LSFSKIRQQVGNAIAGKQAGSTTFSYDAMQKAGLQVITSERIYDRQREQTAFNDLFNLKPKVDAEPETKFEFYVEQLNLIWGNYKAYQMAWFRAGSEPGFAQMVTALEGMKEKTDLAIERNRHRLAIYSKGITEANKNKEKNATIINKLTARKEQLVRNFHVSWLIMLMFKYVSAQGNLSWKREDVNPPITLAIQTVQPIQQSYPPTTNEHPKELGTPKPTANWGKPKYTVPVTDEAETEKQQQ